MLNITRVYCVNNSIWVSLLSSFSGEGGATQCCIKSPEVILDYKYRHRSEYYCGKNESQEKGKTHIQNRYHYVSIFWYFRKPLHPSVLLLGSSESKLELMLRQDPTSRTDPNCKHRQSWPSLSFRLRGCETARLHLSHLFDNICPKTNTHLTKDPELLMWCSSSCCQPHFIHDDTHTDRNSEG